MSESFKHWSVIVATFHARNVMLNETNCDWLFDMSVKRPHMRPLTNEGCHLLLTFSCQSEGLAMQDYKIIIYQ